MNSNVDVKNFQLRWSELADTKASEDSSFNFLVPKTEIYYRSKAFVSQVNINPLIAASAPLFFLIEKIQALKEAPHIDKLHDDLIHEINAFEHQAQVAGYKSYVILAARYVLCLWIDQTILAAPWGEYYHWEKIKLTDTPEPQSGSPFYLLLSRCVQESALYIDLLELFYLCLSLGFQDSSAPLLTANLRDIETRDYLLEIISKQRTEFSKKLEIEATFKSFTQQISWRAFVRPLWICLAIFILLGSYWTLNSHLETLLNGPSKPPAFSSQTVAP